MEKRLGAALVLIEEDGNINRINEIISQHADMVLGRQGIPLRDRRINVISLVFEGNTDQIGSLTGKLGRLKGVRVKSLLAG